jgi:AAA15 family ATPase/GTPase
MIIDFSISNYRSIYEKVTLSMQAAKLTGKEDTRQNVFISERYPNLFVLKSAVIYGPNASGKSNLLSALAYFIGFIVDSTDNKFEQELFQRPFKLNNTALSEPTSFEIAFIARDGIRYTYGFSYDKNGIIEEYLYSYGTKETKLFVRKKGEKIQFSSHFRGEKKVLEDQLLNNHLLLSKAANSNYSIVQPAYAYFLNNFSFFPSIIGPDFSDDYLSSRSAMEYDSFFKNNIINFLKVADTGIEGLEVKEEKVSFIMGGNPDGTLDEREYMEEDISVIHVAYDEIGNQERVIWRLTQESSGTIKLFEVAKPVMEVLRKGGVLIIDEINTSLHPLISGFIVQLFNSSKSNPKNAQLIFTTHDVTLLNKDLFRRDQIWFTEKNRRQMTELFSLNAFDKKEVRWDIPFDRWYLSGRFGALPNIQEFKWSGDEA